jgi:hypothetical protein
MNISRSVNTAICHFWLKRISDLNMWTVPACRVHRNTCYPVRCYRGFLSFFLLFTGFTAPHRITSEPSPEQSVVTFICSIAPASAVPLHRADSSAWPWRFTEVHRHGAADPADLLDTGRIPVATEWQVKAASHMHACIIRQYKLGVVLCQLMEHKLC